MQEKNSISDFYKFDLKAVIWAVVLSALYMLVIVFLTGYRPDHLYFLIFYIAAYFAHPITRRFVLGFTIFFIYGIIFDSMKGYPNYWFSDVRIEEAYNLDKYLFGVNTPDGRLTLNEYFLIHTNTFVDVLTGFFYINWMPIPLGFGIYLWIKDKTIFIHYAAAFFTVNVIGWIIYYAYPAAPPWYVQLYGFEEHFNIPGSEAGLTKFDQFFGITVFRDLYATGSNVFAAMPSLHSAYPIIVFFYGIKKKIHWAVSAFFGVFVLGIWFSAVYTTHHYVIDVIGGALCSVTGIWIFERYLLPGKIGELLQRLIKRV